MTTNSKREAKDYAVEKTIETVKILEALEGVNFEPISIQQVIERVGYIPERDEKLKPDAVRRILITLELIGWVVKTGSKWSIGKSFIRFAHRVSNQNV